MHVLVIEDDDATAGYLDKSLRESGHSVDRAEEGKSGLFMAMEGRYDALVVDRMLPGLDGLTIIQTTHTPNAIPPHRTIKAIPLVKEESPLQGSLLFYWLLYVLINKYKSH